MKISLHQKLLRQLEALHNMKVSHLNLSQTTDKDHQEKTREFEQFQMEESQKKEEKELKKLQDVSFNFIYFYFLLYFF